MKARKFWSMVMMLVVMFGTTMMLTSCGSDDPEPTQQQMDKNEIVINGESITVTNASFSLEDGISQIKLRTATEANIEIKFRASNIPVGENVESYNVELEHNDGHKVVEGGPYKLSVIKLADNDYYKIKLPESVGSYKDGNKVKFSATYVGQVKINDYRGSK